MGFMTIAIAAAIGLLLSAPVFAGTAGVLEDYGFVNKKDIFQYLVFFMTILLYQLLFILSTQ